ncbi:hypothetical protein ACIGD1_18210 [Streptomyces sp. NPDC085612]|uniref:hypothetical protein n=1 Tax=Streptomyces sp. NPDC085612 TaxID=3365732 RepID=UPI0037D8F927
MHTTGDERIGVVARGTTRTPGGVEPLPGGRLLVRTPGRAEVHDREDFLAGRTDRPAHVLRTGEGERAAPTADGGFVVAGPASVRAVGPDGSTRWTRPHDPWHGTGGAPAAPSVSPDGRLVSVVVPTVAPDRDKAALVHDQGPRPDYTWDALLLLDAGTGAVIDRKQLRSLTSGTVQAWRADGTALGVSCWTAWHSWSTWWAQPSADGLRFLGGTWMHSVAGFLPGGGALTQRFAEHVFPDDDRDELAVYDLASAERTALLDLTELGVDPENDEFSCAEVLDGRHVLVPGRVYPEDAPPEHRHWLVRAEGLRPRGRLDYPVPAGEEVTPLGDGTWLTRDGDLLHRWSLADASA